MSTPRVVRCDGCDKTVDVPKDVFPIGWMRLTVTGRKGGQDGSGHIARVDICGPLCAAAALVPAADLVAPTHD